MPSAFAAAGLPSASATSVVVACAHRVVHTGPSGVRSASDPLVRVGLLNVAGTALILLGGAIGGVTQLVLWILVPLV